MDKVKELNTKITFQLVTGTEVNVLEDGKVVGSIWSHSKNHYPYTEKEGYESNPDAKREEIQICGFTKSSTVWDCGIFKNKKDLVVTFNQSAVQDMFSKEKFFHEVREWCKEHRKGLMINADEFINFINKKLS